MTGGQDDIVEKCGIDWFLRQAWRWAADVPEESPRTRRPGLAQLQESQWNREFESLMRNRLIMGAFRYGTFGEQSKVRHDNPKSILTHLVLYMETGNAEHLVDIANLALVEFTLPSHPSFHFEAIDDGAHHTRRIGS
jgi:hypothetical protein